MFCSVLPEVMKALKPGDKITLRIHEQFFASLLDILKNRQHDRININGRVLKALDEMTGLLGRDGLKSYADTLVFHLEKILCDASTKPDSSKPSDNIFKLTVKLVGKLFSTLESDATPHLATTVNLLIEQKQMTLQVRAQCVLALSKIAVAVGAQRFRSYLPAVMQILQESSELGNIHTVSVKFACYTFLFITNVI